MNPFQQVINDLLTRRQYAIEEEDQELANLLLAKATELRNIGRELKVENFNLRAEVDRLQEQVTLLLKEDK